MHKSTTFWQGFRNGLRTDGGDIPRLDLLDQCCTDSYLLGYQLGRGWSVRYAKNKDRLRAKLYWLAPIGAAIWFLADKILHLFGICLGG